MGLTDRFPPEVAIVHPLFALLLWSSRRRKAPEDPSKQLQDETRNSKTKQSFVPGRGPATLTLPVCLSFPCGHTTAVHCFLLRRHRRTIHAFCFTHAVCISPRADIASPNFPTEVSMNAIVKASRLTASATRTYVVWSPQALKLLLGVTQQHTI